MGDKIKRKRFYDGWRDYWGKLEQPLVNRVNFLLDSFDASEVFDSAAKIAFGFGTIKKETNGTFAPVNEGYWLKDSNRVNTLYNYYRNNNVKALATIFPNGRNGKNYLGRGYVQVTHDYNAQKLQEALGIPFYENPDLLLDAGNAFKAMEYGVSTGLFTGKKLDDYFSGDEPDFFKSRKIINGMDCAGEIAEYCQQFYNIIDFE